MSKQDAQNEAYYCIWALILMGAFALGYWVGS